MSDSFQSDARLNPGGYRHRIKFTLYNQRAERKPVRSRRNYQCASTFYLWEGWYARLLCCCGGGPGRSCCCDDWSIADNRIRVRPRQGLKRKWQNMKMQRLDERIGRHVSVAACSRPAGGQALLWVRYGRKPLGSSGGLGRWAVPHQLNLLDSTLRPCLAAGRQLPCRQRPATTTVDWPTGGLAHASAHPIGRATRAVVRPTRAPVQCPVRCK